MNCWCGENKTELFLKGNWKGIKFSLGKCSCGTIRTIDGFEQNASYDANDIYTKLGPRHLNSINLINDNVSGKSILDIGCNSGLVLNSLWEKKEKNNLEIFHGIDFNDVSFNNNENLSLVLMKKDLKDLHQKYDNIIMLHVLEHVPNLEEFLHDVNNLLNVGGMFFVSVPNVQCDDFSSSWSALAPNEHYWHFSFDTYRKMLSQMLPNFYIEYEGTGPIWKIDDQINIVTRKKGIV